MLNKHPPIDRRKMRPLKITAYAGITLGTIVVACVLAILLFSDPLVNRFIEPRIKKAFAAAYPAYSLRMTGMHFNVFTNRFGFDSVSLRAVDGEFSSSAVSFSVSGIGWAHLLWGGTLAADDFTNSMAEGQDIELNLRKYQYRLRCKLIRMSVPKSEIVTESLNLEPLGGDKQFFDGSPFRKTRLNVVTRRCSVEGLAFLEILKGENYHAHSVEIRDAEIDVLLNKDRPDGKDTSGPFMPNEILGSIKRKVNVDRVSITNGQLKYSERFDPDAKPSFITFDSMNVLAEGIANYGPVGSVFVVHADTKFADAGTMTLNMTFPVASPDFSFKYSGSLSGMDLRPINSFLEISDQMRIKSGVLEGVTYDIQVVSGHAKGSVNGVYRELSMASITKSTGSEKGVSNAIKTFVANTFKIRKDNVPGAMKIGRIRYDRVPDDPFFQYAWFSLRTGVQDVLGL
jgi:hypothetical protein